MFRDQSEYNEYTALLYDKESTPSSSSSSSSSMTSARTKVIFNSPIPCTITLLLSAFIPSLGGFVSGYDQTLMESILALPNFQHHYFYGNHLIGEINPFDYITSGYYTMTILGSLYGGYICDKTGRKRSLIKAFLLFALGIFLDIVCRHSLAFLTGRLIVGFGTGTLLVASVCMVTEVAPANLRSCLVGFISLLYSCGQLTGYYVMIVVRPRIAASMLSSSSSSKPLLKSFHSSWSYEWRTPLSFGMCICLCAVVALWHLPESPRWLAWTSRHYQVNGKMDVNDEGLRAMACLQERRTDDPVVQQLWKQIMDGCDNIAIHAHETQSYTDYLLQLVGTIRQSPEPVHQSVLIYYQQQRKRRFLLGCGLILVNSATGYDVLVKYYASAVFYASGLQETSLLSANGCTSSLALALKAISLGWCVDYFGRKNFLFVGALVMALCHLGLGGVFHGFSVVDLQTGSVLLMNAHARMMAIVFIYVFIIIYSVAIGTSILVTACEWFSVCDRAKGMALVACLAWSSQCGFAAFARHIFMSPLAYCIFGVSMLLSCYLIYRWVPNSTAKSLEEIGDIAL